MKNPASMNAIQGANPVPVKKDWKKPVLDILELESAENGISHIPDGNIRHHSG